MTERDAMRRAVAILNTATNRKMVHAFMTTMAEDGLDDSPGYQAAGRVLLRQTDRLIGYHAARPELN